MSVEPILQRTFVLTCINEWLDGAGYSATGPDFALIEVLDSLELLELTSHLEEAFGRPGLMEKLTAKDLASSSVLADFISKMAKIMTTEI